MGTHAAPTDWIEDALAALPPLVTVAEAMTVLRTSRRNVYRLTATGRVKALRDQPAGSSRLLIPRSELARYLRALGARS